MVRFLDFILCSFLLLLQSFKGFYEKLLWLGKITFWALWYCKVGFVGCQETGFTHRHILSHIGGEVGSIPPYPTFIPPGLKKSKVTNMNTIWLSQMGQNSIKGFVLWLAWRARFFGFIVPNNICGTNTHDFPRTLSLGNIILYSGTILLNIKAWVYLALGLVLPRKLYLARGAIIQVIATQTAETWTDYLQNNILGVRVSLTQPACP